VVSRSSCANTAFRYTDEAPPKQESALEVKTETIAPAEVKSETREEEGEQNGAGDQQMYGGEQDMDDEIDFNLGNGNGYDAPPNHHEAHGPGIKEDG
jgi:hypothetical protein